MVADPVEQDRLDLQGAARTEFETIVRRGMIVVYGFLGIFFLWGFFVPLSSAVIAAGQVVSDGDNKLLQHVSGGRIKQIIAKDGARLKRGDPVMILDPIINQAELSELKARQNVLLAFKSRLEALNAGRPLMRREKSGDPRPARSGNGLRGSHDTVSLVSLASLEVADTAPNNVYEAQQLEFTFGTASDNAEYKALQHQIDRLLKEKRGLTSRARSLSTSLKITRTELSNMRPLVKQGYMPRQKLWQAERDEARLAAELEGVNAEIAGNEEQVGEARSRAKAFSAGKKRDVSQELTRVLGELAQIRDKVTAAEQAVAHTEIRAPVDGTLVKFSANTVGGIVKGGTVIGEVVPDGADLVVEGRVLPDDIASIETNQSARVVITALNRRSYDPFEATVTYVSADSITEPKTASTYFAVRARIKQPPLNVNGKPLVKPGMQAELYIDAGSRPFIIYMLQPLIDSFAKAFRER